MLLNHIIYLIYFASIAYKIIIEFFDLETLDKITSYDFAESSYCEPTYGNYSTLLEAQQACSEIYGCSGVYDSGCDGGPFKLCPEGNVYKYWTSECSYKKGNYIIVHKHRI